MSFAPSPASTGYVQAECIFTELMLQEVLEEGNKSESHKAFPQKSWPIGQKELEFLEQQFQEVHPGILAVEDLDSFVEDLDYFEDFENECWNLSTGNLSGGEFEKELEPHPQVLDKVFRKFLVIFGDLPDPNTCKKLVEMDLKLKPEWQGIPLRCRPYPLNPGDEKQQNDQVEELIAKGIVEEYLGTDFPKFCSPCFMVPKKGTDTKRLTIEYKRLNARTESHVGSIPNMEVTLERMSKNKWK